MSTIATPVPAPTGTSVYRSIVQDKFTYALNLDETTWQAWKDKVADPITWNVSDQMTANSTKYDEFILYWKCNVEPAAGANKGLKDGCCMVDATNGALCVINHTPGDGTVLSTYRLKTAEWTAAVNAFSGTQASISDAIHATSGALQSVDATHLNYMDSMNCNKDADNMFTCTAWQVAFKQVTDGYPRFGTDETLIAGVID